jgi:hypothetical protein
VFRCKGSEESNCHGVSAGGIVDGIETGNNAAFND